MTPPPELVLISPPWRMPDASCPALGTLRPVLLAEGIPTRNIYGTQLFPPAELGHRFLSSYAAHLFVPHLYPEVYPEAEIEEVIESLLTRFHDDLSLQGLADGADSLDALGVDESRLRAVLPREIERAGLCLERILSRIDPGCVDLVGFSITFESQLIAALAIARRIQALEPSPKVMFGGSACFPELARHLLELFDFVDVVCHAEGESVIGPLVGALRGRGELEDVPGIAYRLDGAIHSTRPPPRSDLNALPIPDYRDFVAQLEASEWRELRPRLYFETSRGCWWGEKHHCSFCGLNADSMTFRKKSPERALAEIRELYTRYPTARRLECTDNILDMGYLRSLMPTLEQLDRDPERPLRIFYEVKASLRRDQLDAMRRAGIDYIQPGIESFSDGVLQLMDKGATGLGQVQLIKWAHERGFYLAYNLILRTPGERAEWYQNQTELIDFIEHLPPPAGVVPVWLERFSPYHSAPERFGLTQLRAKPHYASLYRGPGVDLNRLAYVFDYEHASQRDSALVTAHRAFVSRVRDWQTSYQADRASYEDDGEQIRVRDVRSGELETHRLDGRPAQLFRALDKTRSAEAIERDFDGLDERGELLRAWIERRWVYRDPRTQRHLNVLPRSNWNLDARRPR